MTPPTFGRCRICGCAIVSHGKGFYHCERATGTQPPAHYAEPMTRAVA